MMSHASANSKPPVTAKPFTAAITGTSHLWRGAVPKLKRVQLAFLAPVHILDDRNEIGAAHLAQLRGAKFLQIEAGAKRTSGTGDDHASNFFVGAQILHRAAEPRSQFGIQRVQALRTIERHRRDAVIFGYQNYRFTHAANR